MTLKVKKAKVVVEESGTDQSDEEIQENESVSSQSIQSEYEEDQIDEESQILLNEGWADSIAKILKTNKPKKKKSLVLSKAKKLTDPIKKVTTESYEIATSDGQVRKEQTVVEKSTSVEQTKKRKREIPSVRVKPNILEKDRERTLQKIATKGVVQLFNAVRTQQKDISQKLSEAGPLEVRKEKVLKNIDKRAFLDLLMGEKSSVVDDPAVSKTENDSNLVTGAVAVNKTKVKEPSWNVLRDDFLLSAKIKDWDKEVEEESDKEMEVESD